MHRLVPGLLLLTSSCSLLREASVPMPAVFHAAPAVDADGLVVLLPGFGDSPKDYVAHGVVELIRRTNPKFDVIAADAHFGYYRARTFLERLKVDVIDPVASNYRRIWLVGISMGGFGSSIYALEYPGTIDGMILLAPYMGDHDVISQVDAAGGLASWTPPDLETIEADDTRKFTEMWAWYRGYVTDPANMPKLFIGWGNADRLNTPNGFVAEILPPEQSLSLPGGHKWTVWKPLFRELVVRALAP